MQIVASSQAPAAIGPYSQAIIHNGLVYCSGQIALDPATGAMIEGGVAEQAERAFENLKAVLAAAGSGLDRVIKSTVFLVDMADFGTMNPIYEKHFGTWKPARSTVAVAALPRGGRFEIEVIAAVG